MTAANRARHAPLPTAIHGRMLTTTPLYRAILKDARHTFGAYWARPSHNKLICVL